MRKIAVAISKGGTGKTTTAVNLAHALALAGHRLLLIDTDTQGQAAGMLGVSPPAGMADLIAGTATTAAAIIEARPNLFLLAGGRDLAGANREISRRDIGAERVLSQALQPLDGHYEYVLLDTGPGWGPLTINALFYAAEILAPVSLEILTLTGLLEFTKALVGVQRYNTGLQLRYVLPTMADRRVRKTDEILAQLRAHYPSQLCKPIRYSVRLSEAPGYGQTIFEYAPGTTGAADYQDLAQRISTDGTI